MPPAHLGVVVDGVPVARRVGDLDEPVAARADVLVAHLPSDVPERGRRGALVQHEERVDSLHRVDGLEGDLPDPTGPDPDDPQFRLTHLVENEHWSRTPSQPLEFSWVSAFNGLVNATSLRDITIVTSAAEPVRAVIALVKHILPGLPSGLHLDSCTVVVAPGISSASNSEPYAEDEEAMEIDMGEVVDDWASFCDRFKVSFDGDRILSDVITIRLLHPLHWTEYAYEGIRTLWASGVPLRLEHTNVDGVIREYVPPERL